METKFIVALLFASFLVYIVSAQPSPPPAGADKTALLDSALTDMKCKVTFETDFMNAIKSKFPSLSSSLDSAISALQSDVPQLTNYANQKDVMNYSIYVQEVFTPHLMNAANAQKTVLEGVKDSDIEKEEAKAAMQSLKSTFESLQAAQDSCFDTREHANMMIRYYNNSLNMYQARAKNMSDRNIGSSYLDNLVSNARLQILNPLQSGVKSATTSSQIRELLGKYCLFDGCLNGTNFHMAARYENTRLKILLEVLSSEAASIDLDKDGQPDRDEIKIELDHTTDMINSWESMNADEGQLKLTWENIRTAAKELHDVYVEVGGATETG